MKFTSQGPHSHFPHPGLLRLDPPPGAVQDPGGENNYFMKSSSNLLEQQKLLMYILPPDPYRVFNVCVMHPHH